MGRCITHPLDSLSIRELAEKASEGAAHIGSLATCVAWSSVLTDYRNEPNMFTCSVASGWLSHLQGTVTLSCFIK